MRKEKSPITLFRKVVVPVIYGCDSQAAIEAACAIAGEAQVMLVGFVHIPEREPISGAASQARELRGTLQNLTVGRDLLLYESVRVTHQPWEELCKIVDQVSADLLVLSWPDLVQGLNLSTSRELAQPHCDLAIAGGPVPSH